MAFCGNCGKEMEEGAGFCPHCGAQTGSAGNASTQGIRPSSQNGEDKNSSGLNVLSFFFPLVGLILYLVWKGQFPKKAGGCGKWALIGFITGIVLSILFSVISGVILAAVVDSF